MRILFNDIVQFSDAPKELKSPALSETLVINSPLTITLDKQYPINSVGVGNTDAKNLSVKFNDVDNTVFNFTFLGNGLYLARKTIIASRIVIEVEDKARIGRFGAGLGVNIPTSIIKEPSFKSTSEPRVSLSGQVMPGLGGYAYKTISLDSRYKIGENIMKEIEAGIAAISAGYPFFIDLSDEAYKLPFSKLYANDKEQNNMTFQGGVKKYLYSRRFEFEERF